MSIENRNFLWHNESIRKEAGDERNKTMAAAKKQNEKDSMAVINAQIKNESYAPVYLFYGDETYLVNQYKKKLLEAVTDFEDNMNFARFAGEKTDPMEIIGFCETMPFFADRRVVLAEDTGLFKKSCEGFANRLQELPETSLILFVEQEVDKRNKLYKLVDKIGEALCFETPGEKTLAVWIKGMFQSEGKRIGDKAVQSIIEHTGSDMNLIKNEVDKLIDYTFGREEVTEADVVELCVGNVEGHIFEMIDAISKKQRERAIHLYHELMENREPAMRILFLIARQYDLLLKTKMCIAENKNYAETASVLGVPSWSVKKYAEQCGRYSEKELKEILEACQDTDYRLKTGQASDTVAVEVLIIRLSSPA